MHRCSIGVFGLSGVGKTTLIETFVRNNPEYLSLQAGTLIKRGIDNPEKNRDLLRSNDISKNQKILVREYNYEKSLSTSKGLIFDGHMVVDTDIDLIIIPIGVIKALQLDKIVAVTASGKCILSQRTLDLSRKRPRKSVHAIELQQIESTRLCRSYAEQLALPFSEIDSMNFSRFEYELKNM